MRPPNRWLATPEGTARQPPVANGDSVVTVSAEQAAMLDAILDGDADALLDSIRKGAVVSFVYPDSGWTPMFYAIEHEWPTLVAALLAVGADPEQPNRQGWRPLQLAVDIACDGAAQQGYDEPDGSIVTLLLAAGADPEAKDSENDTAVLLAERYRWVQGIELLTDPR